MSLTGRRFSATNAAAPRFKVTLVRDGFNQPWGFRLAGGADLGQPLTVQRALAGTPSEGELKPGDVITKIGDRDARHLSHKDAQKLITNAGNSVTFQVERDNQQKAPAAAPLSPPIALQKPPVQGAVPTPIAVVTNGAPLSPPAPAPMPVNKPLQVQVSPTAPNGHVTFASPPLSQPLPSVLPDKTKQGPVKSLPVTVFPPPLPGFGGFNSVGQPVQPLPLLGAAHGVEVPECIDLQPYRTTPLVLPGAKAKHEVPTTSYLRHHPNPTMRASPQHYDPNLDVMMKQKVADTVLERVAGPDANNKKVFSKQFNSPIGLYSEQNIVDSVQSQTGVTPCALLTEVIKKSMLKNSMSVNTPVNPPCVIPHSYKGKKTLYYDPAKSETFKALKDSELGDTMFEIPEPCQPKVFTPQKHIQPPLNQMQRPNQSPQPQQNLLGDDKIHQSYSFRRLMNEVLGESEF